MSTERQLLAAFLRQEFTVFLEFAFRELGGEDVYQHNWHIDALAWQLERIRTGDNRRLIVTMPPRHLKSLTVCVAWVAWMLGHNPALRFICVSYGYELAEKHARDCLRLMNSGWYRLAFPRVGFVKAAVLDFETSQGGGRLSTSVGGVVTGRGADIILVDDPIKADDALSETARNAAKTFLFNTLLSRLNDQTTGSIILVMQRLHEADLAGELLSLGGWHELRLPAIATEDETIQTGEDSFYQRRCGCALHPSRLPLSELYAIRARDSRAFASQYQQEPVPAHGNFVDPDWLQYYDEPPTKGIVVQSWDTASKTGVNNDYSVAITAVYHERRFYVLDVFRRRVDFVALRARLCMLCEQYGVERLLIEEAASGLQLIQLLRQSRGDSVPLPIACKPEGDKLSRFAAQASQIEAGALVLPRTAPWLAEFISEVIGFPNARYDDQADALAQMLRHAPRKESPVTVAGPLIYSEETGWRDYGF